jgi:hypothetical protein
MAKLIIKLEYNTSAPNYIYELKLWHSEGKGVSAHYVLIYLLLIDKVTQVYDEGDGTKTGLVLGGVRLSFKDIENALGCSYSTAKRACAHLVRVGLIRRHSASRTTAYKYEVLNCRKDVEEVTKDGLTHPVETKKLKGKYHCIEEIPTTFDPEDDLGLLGQLDLPQQVMDAYDESRELA